MAKSIQHQYFPIASTTEIGGTRASTTRIPQAGTSQTFDLVTDVASSPASVILDFGVVRGGKAAFNIDRLSDSLSIELTYSESEPGIHHPDGDGPYYLFSNAMATYRSNRHELQNTGPWKSTFVQESQRYLKITLHSPGTLKLSSICLESELNLEEVDALPSSFECSDVELNNIWRDGTRTVQLCTVPAGYTENAWEVIDEGTRICGQHWAPCREGTRWGDIIVDFDMKMERGGASWGVHMVTTGAVICVEAVGDGSWKISVVSGLANRDAVFPVKPCGTICAPANILQWNKWHHLTTRAVGSNISISIDNKCVGIIEGVTVEHLLLGWPNNTGSIAFGGPSDFVTVYKNLSVTTADDKCKSLYSNSMTKKESKRVLEDFCVGTNEVAVTVDGAKRDRALFGGDLFVLARSIYYSTGATDAILGGVRLMTAFQDVNGYLGNLVPIQETIRDARAKELPPTYVFYSLSYALHLISVIVNYWTWTGDEQFAASLWDKIERQLAFTKSFKDKRGLITPPPTYGMDWFPMAGPHIGASMKINLAYIDALRCAATLATSLCKSEIAENLTIEADSISTAVNTHLYDSTHSLYRSSDTFPVGGLSQDANGFALSSGVAVGEKKAAVLKTLEDLLFDGGLPPAFRNAGRLDETDVVSPYASCFHAEGAFMCGETMHALKLIRRVWGAMADKSGAMYSGCHWEAMKSTGDSWNHDTSLCHGWSTAPTYLLPQYILGVAPTSPGFASYTINPQLGDLSYAKGRVQTPRGKLSVEWKKAGDKVVVECSLLENSTFTVAIEGWEVDNVVVDDALEGVKIEQKSPSVRVSVEASKQTGGFITITFVTKT